MVHLHDDSTSRSWNIFTISDIWIYYPDIWYREDVSGSGYRNWFHTYWNSALSRTNISPTPSFPLQYFYRFQVDEADPRSGSTDQWFTKVSGHQLLYLFNWVPGKNVTVKLLKKLRCTSTSVEEQRESLQRSSLADSLFNFFNPPQDRWRRNCWWRYIDALFSIFHQCT